MTVIHTTKYYENVAIFNLQEAVAEQTCAAWETNEAWLDEARDLVWACRHRCCDLQIPGDMIEDIIAKQRKETEDNLRWEANYGRLA